MANKEAFFVSQLRYREFAHKVTSSVGTAMAFYRGQKGLSLENSEKGPLSPRSQRKGLNKSWQSLVFIVFVFFSARSRLFLDFFRAFLTPGREASRTPFLTFFFGVSREMPFWPFRFIKSLEGQPYPKSSDRSSGSCWKPCLEDFMAKQKDVVCILAREHVSEAHRFCLP